MTKNNLFLCTACVLSAVALSNFAWTQDSAPQADVKFGGVRVAPTPSAHPRKSGSVLQPDTGFSGGGFPAATGFGGGFGGGGGNAGGGVFRSDMIPRVGVVNFVNGPMRARLVTENVHRIVHEPIPPEELEQNEMLFEAMQTLKSAMNAGEKAKAAGIINDQLVKQFEKDLAQREKELASVEERLKSLREQLEKRKVSKDEIVNLRLKTILNNAEGLGFPGDVYPADPASIEPTRPEQPVMTH